MYADAFLCSYVVEVSLRFLYVIGKESQVDSSVVGSLLAAALSARRTDRPIYNEQLRSGGAGMTNQCIEDAM